MPTGYPQDWILGRVDLEDMECPICCDLKRDAVITDCKHSFCGDCLAAWFQGQYSTMTCPYCRGPHHSAHLDPDDSVRAAIDAMQAKCPHCPFTDTLPSVFLHESRCASRPHAQPNVVAVAEDARVLTEFAQTQMAMQALRVQVGANGRACRCRVCAATPDNRLSSYLVAATAAIELPATVVRLVVVQAPPGADFFFVAQEGAVRHRNSNAFIHMATFTKIVRGMRAKYHCDDETPITRPSLGMVLVGVLNRDDAGRFRVDGNATEDALTGRMPRVARDVIINPNGNDDTERVNDTSPVMNARVSSVFYEVEWSEDMYSPTVYAPVIRIPHESDEQPLSEEDSEEW